VVIFVCTSCCDFVDVHIVIVVVSYNGDSMYNVVVCVFYYISNDVSCGVVGVVFVVVILMMLMAMCVFVLRMLFVWICTLMLFYIVLMVLLLLLSVISVVGMLHVLYDVACIVVIVNGMVAASVMMCSSVIIMRC